MNNSKQDPSKFAVTAAVPVVTGDTSVEYHSKEQEVSDISGSQKQPYTVTMDEQQLSESQVIEVSPSKIQETTPLDEDDDHSDPILVRRMFEVFCISIHPMHHVLLVYPDSYKLEYLLDGNPCHIYGLVRVFSEDGQVLFDIYNRKEDNCEIVPLGGFLSITSSHVISPTYLKVVVYLYDMAHGVEIANGVFNVDCRYTNNNYDKLKKGKVNGEYGYASVQYSTFQHAVVANVENVVLNQVGKTGSDANNGMLRTVTARIVMTCKGLCDEEYPPSILFKNTQVSNPFHLGVPIKLCRTSVVVPPFCNLVISFSGNADSKVVEDIIFEVRDGGSIQKSSQGQCFELEMKVKWEHGYTSEITQPLCISDFFSFPRVLSNKQSSSNIARAIPKFFPCVEIFSVLIWIDDVDVDISGIAEIMDSSHGPFHIFIGEERWFPGSTLPILGPPCSFDNQPFKFRIRMKDEEKRFVSKGSFEWNSVDDHPISFYDKPLCSVIQGEVGYAAVHYTMISCGIQARIKVRISKLVDSCKFCAKVYGKITGEYQSYEYPTLYDKEFYKSIIFSKPESDCALVKVDGSCSSNELPLSKSVMSVPLDDVLVLDMDLVLVIPVKDDDKWEDNSVHVKARWECPTNVKSDDSSLVKNYAVGVSVDWSNERYVQSDE